MIINVRPKLHIYYAGIGARSTPQPLWAELTELAKDLSSQGLTLRSGGAIGADSAFEKGAKYKEILRPKGASDAAIHLAAQYHPAWDRCSSYVQMLHGRNAQIILGPHLDKPVKFVLYYSTTGQGGTQLGVDIAADHGIPTYNLAEHGFDHALVWSMHQ